MKITKVTRQLMFTEKIGINSGRSTIRRNIITNEVGFKDKLYTYNIL